MTNEEINAAISEARGLQHAKIEETSICYFYCPRCHPNDWTGSEDASAVLLEEMPEAELTGSREEGKWGCHHNGGHGCEYVWHESRKVAIALAWLAWKGKG